ncbi:MAG: hypothetical protein PHT29_06030 [Eubacteriales bacterium]|nr:hypothetical protein [Eubacteriales bacterium]MDD3290427.1 hypothetical protein [Eubacteriales bacterium]MDD3863944.1 hypothetical protein [Eubacteriales bacterium]
MKKTSKPPRAPSYPRHTPVKSHINRRKSKISRNKDQSILFRLFDLFKW